jgi:Flp pilus assembly protein TadG
MLKRSAREFWRNEGAAIAPLYALALFGLIGVAGVGWDYGRLMAMDSELQNAADQAALAAATQLDGGTDAITRAEDAARDYLATAASDWVNQTRNANDGGGRPITDLTFNFYAGYDSDSDTFTGSPLDAGDADDNESAKVVEVVVNNRRVFYALTPVVGAISSGSVIAEAVAGIEQATCNVPPLMFCAPTGDANFPGDDDIGKGVAMHMRANQTDAWAPGNFGFLDIDYPGVAPSDSNHLTGLNSEFLGCTGEGIESRTGSRTPEVRALNTRFDIYDSSAPSCTSSNGDFCPAQNTTKNWVVAQSFNNNANAAGPACDASPNNPTWVEASTIGASNVGFPQDTSTVNGFGNGVWNGDAYMAANHPGTALSDIDDLDGNGSISRYEVYEWELENTSSRLATPTKVGYTSTLQPSGKYSGTAYCAYPQPFQGTAVTPNSSQKDRRLVTIAAVDCSDLNGHAQVKILRWVDLFLVQPADDASSDKSFYAEVKSIARTPGGDSAFQFYGRNKPVLLR